MPVGTPIRVALVGAGSMGKNHLRVLQGFAEEQVEVVGVADAHGPTLRSAAGRSRLQLHRLPTHDRHSPPGSGGGHCPRRNSILRSPGMPSTRGPRPGREADHSDG